MSKAVELSEGDKVRVKPDTVVYQVWEMLRDDVGTVTHLDGEELWDYIVEFPNSGRVGNKFGFMADQLEKI